MPFGYLRCQGGQSIKGISRACSEGAQDGLTGRTPHPRLLRRCQMRGRPRAARYPCAGGNAAYDPRGSHWGRSEFERRRVTRSERSNPGGGLTSGGRGSRARVKGPPLQVGPAPRAQGSRQRQALPPRPIPAVAPARVGLGLWTHVHRPNGSGSLCAQLMPLATLKRGLKIRPRPLERRATRIPSRMGETGGTQPGVLAGS